MLRHAGDITGMPIEATDGEIGSVKDLFFDEESWVVRYLVVRTDGWLAGRRVLLAPAAVDSLSWDEHAIRVGVDSKSIEDSPPVDEVKPVSRLQEIALARHYGWPIYWTGYPMMGGAAVASPELVETLQQESQEAQKELARTAIRSFVEVDGYEVVSSDEEDLGKIRDFVVDDTDWAVRYIVVETGGLFHHDRVLLDPRWLSSVDWASHSVTVRPRRKQVEQSPPLSNEGDLTVAYARKLEAHYGLGDKEGARDA